MKLDAIAFAAHPDDTELGCSGTLASLKAAGKKVGVVDLTLGQLGTRGNVELRQQEAAAAAELQKLDLRLNLEMEDGFFQNDRDHQLKIVEVIRKYQPDVVFCNAISDRHPDHGKASKLVADACFLAGLEQLKLEGNSSKYVAWRPKTVYHYIQDRYITPDFVVDITPYFEKKMASIKAFRSQFYDPESTEKETPISTAHFLDFIAGRALDFGRLIGVQYGEGFTVDRPVGVKDVFNLL